MRLISFAQPRSPSSPMFTKLKILKIFGLVKVLNVLFVHQFLNSDLPSDLHNNFNFTRVEHRYSTRRLNLGLLTLPKIKTKMYGMNSMCMQAISQWNFFQLLHPNVDMSKLSLSKIKSLITTFLLKLLHLDLCSLQYVNYRNY